jgi:hypothetical protein
MLRSSVNLNQKELENEELNSIHEELENIQKLEEIIGFLEKQKLENNYQNSSEDAEIADKARSIQTTFDKIKEFYGERNFSRIYNATHCIIEEANCISKCEKLGFVPQEIFHELSLILKDGRKSLNELENSCKILYRLASLGRVLSKKEFEELSENLEIFAERIEEHIEILNFNVSENLEEILEKVVLFSRIKSGKNDRRDKYRRRTRYAAVFVLNLIDNLREEAELENHERMRDFTSIIRFED